MSITPFQAGLGAFIDLNKPDFIGKVALLCADRRPLLYGLKCASTTPDSQAKIMNNNICVGRITVSAWSPFLDCGIGYVRFSHADDWTGKPLMIKTPQGDSVACEIVELPFYDAEKRIPRGLATTDL